MLFSELSTLLSKIEATSKRLEMTSLLVELFKKLDKDEIQSTAYLLQGKLVARYESKEFQLSDKMVMRALSRILNDSDDQGDGKEVLGMYKKLGDLGFVAEKVKEQKNEKDSKLSIPEVFTKLTMIAEDNGQGSQERKVNDLTVLLQGLDSLSSRYVVRIVLGKLRLGFSDMTMIDALSWVLKGDKSLSSEIEDAYQKRADIGYIAHLLLTKGFSALQSVKVAVGTPIIPALCQRLNSAAEIIEKMTEVFAEPKYDGTRVQIHYRKASLQSGSRPFIRTFTRNLEESTHMFPELVEAVKSLNCDSCILDSEAIGYDPKTGNLLLFQQTMQRKRKHGIDEMAKDLPLKFFVFDVMEKDGVSLIETPLSQRKVILKSLFKDTTILEQSPFIRTNDATELHEFHEAQLAKGLEGAVIKTVDGAYQSGRKAYSWVKIKETEGNRGKLSDTVDCVVMGYYVARGTRSEFQVGAALTGVLDEEGNIVTISKVGSGFSEELAKDFMMRIEKLKVAEKPNLYQVNKGLIPDVWLSPGLVMEVAADEMTISTQHTAGLAFRFPRLVRFRDDKSWQEATTLKEVKQIAK
ncbi:MAG: ATP-dependent DNA ligase [Patescibacteria group bacterium]